MSYHPAHVSRILHSLEFSVQRPQKVLARADKALQSKWVRYRYPNLKKKPKAKRRPSSSQTKPASARTLRSTKPGRAGGRSRKSPRQGKETP
ncbi:MAG: winged helix-turn-helix domain-containing protein [Candidatus Binatia bacterium]